MFGLEVVDLVALAAYLIGITVLGVWMSKTIHNTTDYFVGGRRFGKLLSTFFTFGAGTHSDQAVSVAAKTYTSGMSGIWYQWLWLLVTPFYWWIAPLLRRARAITAGDYFEARYSRSVATLYVLVGILNLMVNIGVMLKGSGAVIHATTAGGVNESWAIAVMTVLFVAYGVAGGLPAAVVTDFVQGLLTILFSFILLPFAIYELGGFSDLHEQVATTFQAHPIAGLNSPSEMWELVTRGEITLIYVLVVAFNGLVGFGTQPHAMVQYNAARNDQVAQVGAVAGGMIKRFCTVSWTFLGMCAFVMFAGMTEKNEIDQCFGMIAYKLLPGIMPGLIGLFIASLLATVMSSCDAFMITCSGLFTHNVYRPLIAPNRPDSHYVFVGRIAGVLCVVGGVFFAYRFESVVHGLELFWKISALMGISFWMGLFWRRATSAGVWVSALSAFAVMWATHQSWFVEWARVHTPYLLFTPDAEAIYLPMHMLMYLGVGFVTMVGVSLVTTPPPAKQLERFYAAMRTPVQPGEVIEQPVSLPAGATPAPQRKLINHPDWEIQRPTARGWIGFFITWVVVLMVIASVWVLVRIGAP